MEELPEGYNNGHVDEGRYEDHEGRGLYEAGSTSNGGAFSNVAQGLTGDHRELMLQYWQETINSIEHDDHKFKIHQLPLARIKKVMKADEDVRMISAEAPILFAKGCDIFITELTMRAWIHAEENKRRTLQRSDIANALQKSDMFDFLIDIVPREEAIPAKKTSHHVQHYHQQQQQPEEHHEEHDYNPESSNQHHREVQAHHEHDHDHDREHDHGHDREREHEHQQSLGHDSGQINHIHDGRHDQIHTTHHDPDPSNNGHHQSGDYESTYNYNDMDYGGYRQY
jgi:nuclear transcription factor Y, gamma